MGKKGGDFGEMPEFPNLPLGDGRIGQRRRRESVFIAITVHTLSWLDCKIMMRIRD